jgi:hypothetical protein
MAKIEAIAAFQHLGKKVSVTTAEGTTVSGILEYVGARLGYRGDPADMTLTIGGYDVEVIGAYGITVDD